MIDVRDPAERRRIARFLAVGIGNTLFGYALFALLVTAGLDSALALLGATVAGVMFNFFTTGRLVFASRDHRLLPRFVLAYGASYLFNLLLLKGLEAIGVATLVAQLACLPPTVIVSYLLLNRFVFRRSSS